MKRPKVDSLIIAMVRASLILILAAMPTASKGADKDPISSEQILRWVKELNSNTFIERELATERLVGAGMQAIEPVVYSLGDSNPELAARAVHILRELALGNDEQVSFAGQAALERVAQSNEKSVSRRATAALEKLSAVRQDRAIKHLSSVGVSIVPNAYVQVGQAFVQNVNTVEVGENWKGDPKDLAGLKWLADFQQVKFIGEGISDECVAQASGMKNLEFVTVKRAKITDAAMRHLAGLEKIKQLEVMYSPVSDKSIEHLAAHKSATRLKIFGTRMSTDGAARLKNILAGVDVDHRNGAFLGVGCEPHDQGCMIRIMQDGSAAMHAGLQIGDVITKYGDKPVDTFEKLTELISQNSGGDTIKLEILRGAESLTKSIKLGEWE